MADPSETADLSETIEDGIATLTLNRPERLNAFSPELLDLLRAAFTRLGSDPGVGVIILTGAGRAFSAGGDIKGMGQRAEQPYEQRVENIRLMHQLPLLMRMLPKVIIGMVNGPAAGAGLGLAMACDLRIAARSARFGTAFAGMGFSGDFGGTWLMTRLLGTAKARELYFLPDLIGAEEAARIGLVTRVVDDAALFAETWALARRIADGPRIAMGYMKRNLHAAETEPFAPVLEMEAVHQARCAQTEDHREAVRAFIEKRKPAFKDADMAAALTLFLAPGSSSMAPHIALREVGAAFECRPLSFVRGEHKSPAYLAINPEGKVPTLLIDGAPLTEVAAILFYLARAHPASGLLPDGAAAEAQVIAWMSFIAATLHPARSKGIEHVMEVWGSPIGAWRGRDWAIGSYSIADIHLFRVYWRLRGALDPAPGTFPALDALYDRMMARPAVLRTIADETAIGYELPA